MAISMAAQRGPKGAILRLRSSKMASPLALPQNRGTAQPNNQRLHHTEQGPIPNPPHPRAGKLPHNKILKPQNPCCTLCSRTEVELLRAAMSGLAKSTEGSRTTGSEHHVFNSVGLPGCDPGSAAPFIRQEAVRTKGARTEGAGIVRIQHSSRLPNRLPSRLPSRLLSHLPSQLPSQLPS